MMGKFRRHTVAQRTPIERELDLGLVTLLELHSMGDSEYSNDGASGGLDKQLRVYLKLNIG